MIKRFVMMIALTTCGTLGIAPMSIANDRQEMREAAGVEAGDRGDRRREVRDNTEVDVDDRKEAREEHNVEAGDRADARNEARESFD